MSLFLECHVATVRCLLLCRVLVSLVRMTCSMDTCGKMLNDSWCVFKMSEGIRS